MSARRKGTQAATPLSRRRFVSLLAAGSAAALTPAAAAPASRARKPVAPPAAAPPPPPTPEQKEFDRQRANTLSALKTIRSYKLPPGGDLPVVFRPLPSPRRSR